MSWLKLWIMGAVKPMGQLYGSPTALTNQYLAWDRYCLLLYICCSNSESGETNTVSGKIRLTVAPEPRKGDQSLM